MTWFALVSAYLLIGGVVGGAWEKLRCKDAQTVGMRAVSALVVWPLVIAFFAGELLVERFADLEDEEIL